MDMTLINKINQIIFRLRYGKSPNLPMVSYWKFGDAVEAKQYIAKEGHIEMQMKGEKYPFYGYPRGNLLFGSLSPLKHLIKNKIFNETWAEIDKIPDSEVIAHAKKRLYDIFTLSETGKEADEDSIKMTPMTYDQVPYERLCPPVKEVWRAMTAIENGSQKVRKLKEIICFILQEDDAYRFRLQWIVKFFPRWWKPKLKHFDYALSMLEQGEMVSDMKEKQRLFRTILIFLLQDKAIRARFDMLLKEMDWNKLRMTKADKYFFRAKFFKCDYPEYSY